MNGLGGMMRKSSGSAVGLVDLKQDQIGGVGSRSQRQGVREGVGWKPLGQSEGHVPWENPIVHH